MTQASERHDALKPHSIINTVTQVADGALSTLGARRCRAWAV